MPALCFTTKNLFWQSAPWLAERCEGREDMIAGQVLFCYIGSNIALLRQETINRPHLENSCHEDRV